MRYFAICAVTGGLGFVIMGLQMGLFSGGPSEEPPTLTQEEKKLPPKKTKFPEDLAPTVKAQPVPEAAPFQTGAKFYPMVFLKTNGAVYDKWQELLNEGWAAESVEATQLAVVLGPPKETYLDITHYPKPAPPIRRFKHEMEVSVVEAKTGKVLANRQFVNIPRAIKQVESWELTRLGQPVAFKTVFDWVVANARANFPEAARPDPLITITER